MGVITSIMCLSDIWQEEPPRPEGWLRPQISLVHCLSRYYIHARQGRYAIKSSLLILAVLIIVAQAERATAQTVWTPPAAIDTSVFGPQLGGMMALDDSGTVYVTWAQDTSIVIERSTDRGESWMRHEYSGPELSRVPRDIVVDHAGTLWLLWISWAYEFAPAYLNLSRSTDNGATFTSVFRSLSFFDGQLFQKLVVDSENSLYMLWDDTQFKLTRFRHGDVVQRYDTEIPNDTLLIGSLPQLFVSPDFAVHCAWEGSFYDTVSGYHEFVFYSRSNDTGATFVGRTRIDTADHVGSMFVHHYPALAVDSTGGILVTYTRELAVGKSDIRIVRSGDGGTSFSSPMIVSDSDASTSFLAFDSQGGTNILWNMTTGSMHRRSTDGGTSFSIASSVGPVGVHDLAPTQDGFLYATGERNSRVCFSKTNVLLPASEDPLFPRQFLVLPPYPNPFNSTTSIQLAIAVPEIAEVTIYDVLGRYVSILFSGRLDAGLVTLRWDASNLASGVYFVRFFAGKSWIATSRVVLMR